MTLGGVVWQPWNMRASLPWSDTAAVVLWSLSAGCRPMADLTWNTMTALEPALVTLADAIASGKQTLTDVRMPLGGGLTSLVGRFALHPRLRSSACYAAAYLHLSNLSRQRRLSRVLAEVPGVVTADKITYSTRRIS